MNGEVICFWQRAHFAYLLIDSYDPQKLFLDQLKQKQKG